MKVKELVEELQKLEGDLEVHKWEWSCGDRFSSLTKIYDTTTGKNRQLNKCTNSVILHFGDW